MLHGGVKQHDGMSGLISRLKFALVLMLEPGDRSALKKNRRVMLRVHRNDMDLSHYSESDDAIEATDMPNRYVVVTLAGKAAVPSTHTASMMKMTFGELHLVTIEPGDDVSIRRTLHVMMLALARTAM